jgi:hypothetical protein
MKYLNVNAHLHTPYSFSAFDSIEDAVERAADEDVQVLGINDFYSTDGFELWNKECRKRHIYPLFNIELISLQQEDRDNGVRVNDPNNPGRTYISGKGLKCPPELPQPYSALLANVRAESNRQVLEMCNRLNALLHSIDAGFTLDFNLMEQLLTKGLVRERHLAKFLRLSIYKHFRNEQNEIIAFMSNLFSGKNLKSDVYNYAGVENEIRSNLLKAGGKAFVPEEPNAFLPLDKVRETILAAGGIPTYPFLADDSNGKFTDFEQDILKAATILKQRGFYSAEFITTRNSAIVLEEYASFLCNNGFIVTFGSEHNTPAMEPIELFDRDKQPLSNRLRQINYESACIIAAHQFLNAQGKQGFLNDKGVPDMNNKHSLVKLGDEIITKVTY